MANHIYFKKQKKYAYQFLVSTIFTLFRHGHTHYYVFWTLPSQDFLASCLFHDFFLQKTGFDFMFNFFRKILLKSLIFCFCPQLGCCTFFTAKKQTNDFVSQNFNACQKKRADSLFPVSSMQSLLPVLLALFTFPSL